MSAPKNADSVKSPATGKFFWGPPVWTTIHILAATFRPENADAFKTFLECLTKLLPCEECKRNLRAKLDTVPPDAYLSNNNDAFFYTYLLHDLANEQISSVNPSTPKESPDFDSTKNFYFRGLGQACKECNV